MGGERLPGARRPAQARKIKVGPMGERGAKVAKEVLSKESGGRQSQLLCLILFFLTFLPLDALDKRRSGFQINRR